jgi:hypothetical protein
VADGVDLWTGAPHLLSLRDTCNLLMVLAPLRPPPPPLLGFVWCRRGIYGAFLQDRPVSSVAAVCGMLQLAVRIRPQ